MGLGRKPAYPAGMEIDVTPERVDFVRLAVSAGRFEEPEQAVREAMALGVERERLRVDLLASLDDADASIAAGAGIELTPQGMAELTRSLVDGRNRPNKSLFSAA